MQKTKKSLLASGLALIACLAMLIGTTFAWFTDSVTNRGNIIQSGNLKIDVVGYYLNGDQWDKQNINWGVRNPMIRAENWEPGQYNAAVILVSNYSSSLAARVDLDFTITEESKDLADALWYKLTPIPTTYNNLDAAVPMDRLIDAGSRPAVPGDAGAKTMAAIESDDTQEITLQGGQASKGRDCYVFYLLEYGMYTSAGNEYQNGSFGLDFTVKATQAPVEEDGFGSDQYDAQAGYPVYASVADGDALIDALNHSGVPVTVTLTDTPRMDKGTLDITGEVTMNMGANQVVSGIVDSPVDITVKDGGTLTVQATPVGSGFTYNLGDLSADGEGSTLYVNGGRYGNSGAKKTEVTAKNGSAIYLTAGAFTSSGYQGHAVTAMSGATVYISGGSYGPSGAESTLLYADGGTIVVTDCEISHVNGKIYSAVNGGRILVSKAFSPNKPTSVASGCSVTDGGDNWIISAQ